jgi:hypothetical protein
MSLTTIIVRPAMHTRQTLYIDEKQQIFWQEQQLLKRGKRIPQTRASLVEVNCLGEGNELKEI